MFFNLCVTRRNDDDDEDDEEEEDDDSSAAAASSDDEDGANDGGCCGMDPFKLLGRLSVFVVRRYGNFNSINREPAPSTTIFVVLSSLYNWDVKSNAEAPAIAVV